MKKIILAFALCMPLCAAAQNTWEMPEHSAVKNQNPDAKYLVGAVPEENGKVVFRTTIQAPGKSADQVYAIVESYLQKMTKEANQSDQSRVTVDRKSVV